MALSKQDIDERLEYIEERKTVRRKERDQANERFKKGMRALNHMQTSIIGERTNDRFEESFLKWKQEKEKEQEKGK